MSQLANNGGGHVVNMLSDIKKREQRALEPRARGKQFDEIARELGYASAGGAHKAMKRALANHAEGVSEYREIQRVRLESALVAIWPEVLRGSLGAIDRLIAIVTVLDRLYGLNAPQQASVVDIEPRVRVLAESLGYDPDAAVRAADRIIRKRGWGS